MEKEVSGGHCMGLGVTGDITGSLPGPQALWPPGDTEVQPPAMRAAGNAKEGGRM